MHNAEEFFKFVKENFKHQPPIINVKLDNPHCMPKRAHTSDAGADLISTSSVDILPGQTKMLDSGVSIAIPEGHVGLVFSRSGQGKINVSLANSVGVIDSAYRGNIKLMLTNDGLATYKVVAFETKIGQIAILPVVLPQLKEVDSDYDWENTERGNNGFGSTGQ